MKKVIFILGVLVLFILNPLSAQNDSVETLNTDSAQEMSEIPDSSIIEEVVETETVEVQERSRISGLEVFKKLEERNLIDFETYEKLHNGSLKKPH